MPRPTGRRRVVVGGLAAVLVAAVGVTAWALTTSSGAAYRTAAAQRGTVEQTVTTTGTLSSVRESDADFQVSGTVAAVRAVVGHKVVAGQVLARLDRSSLRATLTAARSSLTNARAQLTDDQTGQSNTTTSRPASLQLDSATRTVNAAAPRPSRSPTTGSGGGQGSSAVTIKRDQAAIRIAQRATDADLATAKTALATATTACAAQLSSPGPTASPSPSSEPASPATLSCSEATAGLLHDQTTVSGDETRTVNAEQTLSKDLASALVALKPQNSPTTNTSRTGTTSTTRSRAASVTTVTAADIASDQAGIDQARASVATAKASLRQATLTSPISGTVKAVTIGKGDTESGSSDATDPAVEIVGSRQDHVTVYLSDTQIRTVKTGMAASVTPDGSSAALSGTVVAVGRSGTESASGSVTYPVTVNVAAASRSLVAGADAAVSITLATATDVLTVPTSAVHYSGSTAYVEVLNHGALTRRTIKVGAIGPARTDVTSGLSSGQRVVLANLHAAVPSSSTTLSTRVGFGGGGFGGGRFNIGGASAGGFGGPTSGTGGFIGR
jgi:multidrug efflux pump subunit AcrA (membrane-fusion protein)